MAKVICTLPNASTEINGVAFDEHALGMVSEDIEQEQADAFLQIAGYVDHATVSTAAEVSAAVARQKMPLKKK